MNISSSSSSTYVNNASSNKGFSGLASGMDTESMVEALLSGTQAKIDKQNALRQQTVWKQEIYREIITQMNTFQNKYFGSSSSTNFLSSTFFNAMNAVSSSSAFKVSASSGATVGSTSIAVSQLAEAAKLSSASGTRKLSGEINLDAIQKQVAGQARDVTFVVNNKTVKVDFKDLFVNDDGTFKTPPATQQQIADRLTEAFAAQGFDKIKAEVGNDGEIVITSSTWDDDNGVGDSITVSSSSSAAGLKILGLNANASAEVYTGADGKKGMKLESSQSIATGNYFSVDVTFNGSKTTLNIDMTEVLSKGTKAEQYQAFAAQANVQMDAAFGKGNAIMKIDDPATGAFSFDVSAMKGSSIMLSGTNATEDLLGVLNGESNRIGLGGSVKMYFGNAFVDGKAQLEINGKTITITEDMTVGDMIRKVNASGAGVTMTYQAEADRFTLTANSTGAAFDIKLGNTALSEAIFGKAPADPSKPDAGGYTFTAGKNAKATVDGVEIERSSNTFEFNGLNITLTGTTDKTETITVSRNTDQIVDGVKSFIEDYNALIDKLNSLIEEDTDYREYAPLTDAQKKEMSEKEIELWEEKAKKGLLRNDSTISTFLQQMRSAIYQRPAGSPFAIYDLGIETGEWETKGKLVMDADGEATLRAAIESNPDGVVALFTGEQGLASQLDKILTNTASTSFVSGNSRGSLVEIAGYAETASDKDNTLYNTIQQIDQKIKDLKAAYEQEKTRYWNKFNAMESMIQQMSSQSSWLAQQFGY